MVSPGEFSHGGMIYAAEAFFLVCSVCFRSCTALGPLYTSCRPHASVLFFCPMHGHSWHFLWIIFRGAFSQGRLVEAHRSMYQM
eukprot:UN4010